MTGETTSPPNSMASSSSASRSSLAFSRSSSVRLASPSKRFASERDWAMVRKQALLAVMEAGVAGVAGVRRVLDGRESKSNLRSSEHVVERNPPISTSAASRKRMEAVSRVHGEAGDSLVSVDLESVILENEKHDFPKIPRLRKFRSSSQCVLSLRQLTEKSND